MALSDYLSGGEWDACFYASFGKSSAENFGDSMHKTINALLAFGYKFEGLDEFGHKKQQITGSGNPQKLVRTFFGEENGISICGIIENGRSFLKTHCPDLISETDEQFNEAIAALKLHE